MEFKTYSIENKAISMLKIHLHPEFGSWEACPSYSSKAHTPLIGGEGRKARDLFNKIVSWKLLIHVLPHFFLPTKNKDLNMKLWGMDLTDKIMEMGTIFCF